MSTEDQESPQRALRTQTDPAIRRMLKILDDFDRSLARSSARVSTGVGRFAATGSGSMAPRSLVKDLRRQGSIVVDLHNTIAAVEARSALAKKTKADLLESIALSSDALRAFAASLGIAQGGTGAEQHATAALKLMQEADDAAMRVARGLGP